MGDCLIFGKIVGQNAAHPKDDIAEVNDLLLSMKSRKPRPLDSDIKKEEFSTGSEQYIGKSTKGMGDEIVVRVTADKQKNKNQTKRTNSA